MGDGSKSWVVISRGSNRYVEELRYIDPDYSPGSLELVNHIGVGKQSAMKMGISICSEETHASQPKTPSNPVNDQFKEFIPIGERKWNDTVANEKFEGDTLESSISKLVVKLVRHPDPEERETDGAVHWRSIGPKLRQAFQREG